MERTLVIEDVDKNKFKLTKFPSFLPGEIVISAGSRYKDYFGFTNDRPILHDLFGANIATTIDLPTHLSALLERLPKGHGYSEDDLIDRHTLYPFYAFGLPSAREKKLRDAMKGSGNSFIRLSMGIMSGTIPQPQFARYCPMCFNEDTKNVGEPY